MKPGKRNIEITRGDDYAHEIRFQDAYGAPVDKTGCTYQAQLRTRVNDKNMVPFDVDASQLAGGVLVLSLTAALTRGLAAAAVWDLQQTRSTRVTTLLAGSVVVKEDVTR